MLLVEDHADTRDIYTQILTAVGAVVTTMAGARDAARVLDAADVIVTDISMPDTSGLWLLEQARLNAPGVPVIAVSGYTADQVPGLGEARFDLVLLKPVDPWQLAEKIEALMRGRAPSG